MTGVPVHNPPAHAPQSRYHRQSLLPQIGVDGQHRLGQRTALVVGCGALGTVVCDALVRAGVGRLILVDRDVVELTNLQRQTLFDEHDAASGAPKSVAAAARLARINAGVQVVPVIADVSPATIERLMDVHSAQQLAGHASGEDEPQLARLVDVVIDATDNFQTRYLLNDACVKHHVALIYGGAVGTGGMTMTIVPGVSACLRCVFPEAPAPGTFATCDTAGVLGPATGVIANLQAAEAIKVLAGQTAQASTTLRSLDVWSGAMREIDLASARDPACPCCAGRRFEFLDAPVQDTWALCGSDAVQILPARAGRSHLRGHDAIDLAALKQRIDPHGQFTLSAHMLRGRLAAEGAELTVFRDARAIIRGVTDPVRARSLYAKYIGE